MIVGLIFLFIYYIDSEMWKKKKKVCNMGKKVVQGLKVIEY